MHLLPICCLVPLLGVVPPDRASVPPDRADYSPHEVIAIVAYQARHIVAATILDEPVRRFDEEEGTASYRFRVGTVERLVGSSNTWIGSPNTRSGAGSEKDGERGAKVTVLRYESDPHDRPAFLKTDARVVLFLKWDESTARYVTVDPWLGAQRHSESLAETAKRVGTRVWQRRGLSKLGIQLLNDTRPVERALKFAEDGGIDLAKYDIVRATAFRPMGVSHIFYPNPDATGGKIEWRVVVPPAHGVDVSPLHVAVPEVGRPWRVFPELLDRPAAMPVEPEEPR